MKTKKSYMVVHPEMGVYLGRRFSAEVWSSGLTEVGQDYAAVFSSGEEADMYIASRDNLNTPDEYNLVPVEHHLRYYASKAEIEAAQPGAW